MQRISPFVLLIVAGLSGCASTASNDRLSELEQAVERAQATADDALRVANEALMKNDEAMALLKGGDGADGAQSTREIAEQALKEAKAAQQEAERANKRAERMFKMSQSK